MPTWPLFFAATSTFSKCSGIFACVSKLSTTLNICAYFGVCSGRSVALPPHKIMTSILSFHSSTSATEHTFASFVRIETLSGARLVNTATSSISGFCLIAHSTPRPRFPYPKIPIFITVPPNFYIFTFVMQRHTESFYFFHWELSTAIKSGCRMQLFLKFVCSSTHRVLRIIY